MRQFDLKYTLQQLLIQMHIIQRLKYQINKYFNLSIGIPMLDNTDEIIFHLFLFELPTGTGNFGSYITSWPLIVL